MISKTGAATAGVTRALAAGMKIRAAPKPEKPRASPAAPATSTSKINVELSMAVVAESIEAKRKKRIKEPFSSA